MLMESPILRIENLHVSYGKFEALQNINLSVLSGQTFGLIGLNGAGKTTLIKTILGLRKAQSGTITIRGEENYNQQTRRRLAYLPERFSPPDFLSGLEFLQFSLRVYKQGKTLEEYERAAEKVALDPAALKRSVNTYSKGMRQKLGILGTVLTGCDLMILDEPMSGLDPRARSYVKDMVLDLKAKGHTVFLSSHILADMEEICDHVAIIYDKQRVYDGTPKEMLKKTKANSLEHAFLHVIDKWEEDKQKKLAV